MSIENLNIGTSTNNIPTWSISFSDGQNFYADIGIVYEITVPPGATDCLVEATDNVFVSPQTIVLPTSGGGPLPDKTRINPGMVKVEGLVSIFILSPVNPCYAKASFYNNGSTSNLPFYG